MLVEKNGFCGGGAVAGLSGTLCGLYTASDTDTPQQLVYGFAEEFATKLREAGGLTPAQRYGKTLVHTHDPMVWRQVADTLLMEAGVYCLYHTTLIEVHKNGLKVEGVRLFSNDGSRNLRCRVLIDATGDGVAAALYGSAWTCGQHGTVQYPTMMFRMAQVDTAAFHAYYGDDTICPPHMSAAMQAAHASGAYSLPRHHIWIFPTPQPHVYLVNATRILAGHELNPLYPHHRTYAEICGRQAAREVYRFLKEQIPGCEQSILLDMGTEVGVRQTRSIATYATLHNAHVAGACKSPTGIVRCAWPIELHTQNTPKLHWLLHDYYELPYLSLVPRDCENMLVAGRCLGAEHEALASVRVTAQCFEMGHAAACAAGVHLHTAQPLHHIDVETVRESMRAHGSHI